MPPAADTAIISSSSNEAGKINTARLWLVLFCEPRDPAWWARIFRPGFRHVYAVSWYADQERWVEFNPSRYGTVIRIWNNEQFPGVLAQMLEETTVVLRVASRRDRMHTAPFAYCVAAMKALLGVRSWALTPHGLYRDLIARGAETVHAPCVVGEGEAAARSAA